MDIEIDVYKSYENAKELLFTSKRFFTKNKKETGKKKAFSYLATISLAGNLIGMTVLLLILPTLSKAVPAIGQSFVPFETIPLNLLFLVSAYLLGLAGSFLAAGLLFIWLRIFTKKINYDKAYQLFAYSRTPTSLAGWIPGVGVIVWGYSMYILLAGTQATYDLSIKRTILIYIVPIALIFFAIITGSNQVTAA